MYDEAINTPADANWFSDWVESETGERFRVFRGSQRMHNGTSVDIYGSWDETGSISPRAILLTFEGDTESRSLTVERARQMSADLIGLTDQFDDDEGRACAGMLISAIAEIDKLEGRSRAWLRDLLADIGRTV